MAIGVQRRGMDLVVVDFFGEKFLAGFDVHANEHAGFAHLINAAIGQRGTARKHRVLQPPFFPRLAIGDFEVFVFQNQLRLAGGGKFGGEFDADHSAFAGAIDILLAVDGHERVAIDHHGRIHAAVRQLKAPKRLARADVHAHHIAIARAGIKHAARADIGEHRRGKRTVLRRHTRRAGPNGRAGFFLERIKAIARRPLFAPVTCHAAHDDEVAIDHRRAGAAIGKGEPAEAFHQRILPLDFSVGVETFHSAVGGHQINPTGRRIDSRRADGVTTVNRVAQIIVVAVFPNCFAISLVEAQQHLLQIRARAAIAPREHAPIGDHRVASPGDVVRPQRVGGLDGLRQIGGIRAPRLMRPAPIGPASDRSVGAEGGEN